MILVAAPANDIDQPQHTLEYRRALANQSYPCTFEARKCLSLCCTLECNSIEQSVQGCGMTLSVYCGLTATFSPVFAGWNVQCCLRPYGVLWTGGRGWCTLRTSLSGTFLQTLPDLLTSLKGHSLSPRSCPPTRSAPSERLWKQPSPRHARKHEAHPPPVKKKREKKRRSSVSIQTILVLFEQA